MLGSVETIMGLIWHWILMHKKNFEYTWNRHSLWLQKKCHNIITWHYRVFWQPFRLFFCVERGVKANVCVNPCCESLTKWISVHQPHASWNPLACHQFMSIFSLKMDTTSRYRCLFTWVYHGQSHATTIINKKSSCAELKVKLGLPRILRGEKLHKIKWKTEKVLIELALMCLQKLRWNIGSVLSMLLW